MLTRNTLSLIFSGLIFGGFFISGILNILDYFIIKVLLFVAFAGLAAYLIHLLIKDTRAK